MNRPLGTWTVVGLAVIATSCAAAPPAKPSSARLALAGTRTLGTPISFRNLTFVAVYDTAAISTTEYLTLDEGLKSAQVKVREAPQGGDVNRVFISNLSRLPLYLMAGEVVLGGQQDRTLGKDTVIPPGKRDVPVTVFCVEHGRWNGGGSFERTAPALAASDIRARAQEGAFGPSAELSGRAQVGQGRVSRGDGAGTAGVGRAQQEVWDRVARKNQRFGSAPASGTYRGVLTMEGGSTRSQVAPYVDALSVAARPGPDQVGVVAAVNGKVIAADTFGNTNLFRKLWPKLLRTFAAEAAEAADGKTRPQISARQAREFMVQAGEGSQTESRSEVATTQRLESQHAVTYRTAPGGGEDKAATRSGSPAGAARGGAAPGRGAVHESVIRK
jgi:hypothetical protein